MARLPNPGSDDGQWGEILNEYLTQSHNADGTLKASAVDQAAQTALDSKVSKSGDTVGGSLVVMNGLHINRNPQSRIALTNTGVVEFGSGSAVADTNLYRFSAGYLKTDQNFIASQGIFASHNPSGYARAGITASGTIEFGDGTNPRDTQLYRNAPNSLYTPGTLTTNQVFASNGMTISGSGGLYVNTSGGFGRAALTPAGNLEFGDGSTARDTNLYRFGAGILASESRLLLRVASSSSLGLSLRTTSDNNDRLTLLPGRISFGPGGNVATDTTIWRDDINSLKTSSRLNVEVGFTNLSGTIQSHYNIAQFSPASDDGEGLYMLAFQNRATYQSSVNKLSSGSFLGGAYFQTLVSGTGGTNTKGIDTALTINGGATIPSYMGLHVRSPAISNGTLQTSYGIMISTQKVANVTTAYGIYFSTPTTDGAGSNINWNGDTNLYRSASDTLRTDDTMSIGQNLLVEGASKFGSVTRTSAVTLTTSSQKYQIVDASSGAITITLPSTTTAGYEFTIKKIDASANAVTVAGTIDGAVNFVLASRYKYVTLISTTTAGTWYIVANN